MKKICNKCKVDKFLNEFSPNKGGKFGVKSICKICLNNWHKIHYQQNKVELLSKSRIYRENNQEKIREKNKKYNKLNVKIISEKRKIKLNNNPKLKFSQSIRSLISNSLSNKGYTKSKKSKDILGCTIEEFRKYIESKFKPWMNWGNKGGIGINTKNTNWDLDHIIPLNSAKTEKEILKLNHYTNFQPLCSYTNRNLKKAKL